MSGQVTIWTGTNGSGKSTLIGQILLQSVDQGYGVCAYSGELPGGIFRYWIDLQAAGPQYLEMRYDPIKDGDIPNPTPEAEEAIRKWYRDLFFLHDAFGTTTQEMLIEKFEYAVQRYGCKMFLVDNLMTTNFGCNEKDFYRKQSEFVGKMVDFAHNHDVHIHLVAHPRKTNGRLTKMDVAGSGDITNRADNVIAVHRVTPDEQDKFQCDALVDIFKNRFSGLQDVTIRMDFNDKCKRFFQVADGPFADQYELGWVKYLIGGDDGVPEF
jgi:twinkle protein